MIYFEKVTKRFRNGQESLNQVSFHLEKGEMAFLTGHSGAGKSTVLRLIGMMERPTSGKIFVNGYNVNEISQRKVSSMRRFIGVIFQQPRLLTERTIFDNVALPLVILGCEQREIVRRVRAALDKVNLLHKEKSYPEALSMGEQQRVGIARAIVNKPSLLLADEPTGNLDPELSSEIMHLFEQFNQIGVTVLIASHDLALIAGMRHRILTLKEGTLINDGL